MTKIYIAVLLTLGFVTLGCNFEVSTNQPAKPGAQYEPSLIATEEPRESVSVGDARQQAKDQDTISLVGRIGGSAQPFVDGLAAFTLIDLKLPDCAGEVECSESACCTPEELKANLATVKFLNESGKPIAVDARQLLNVESKAKVAVHGKVRRDDAGNLTLLADKLFVYRE